MLPTNRYYTVFDNRKKWHKQMTEFLDLPSIADLARHFAYDPDTGVLIWRAHRPPRIKPGDEAGGYDMRGRVVVGFNGRLYTAARLIWALQTGQWPVDKRVYFKDGDTRNLKWSNLTLKRPTGSRTDAAAYARQIRALNKRAEHVIRHDLDLMSQASRSDIGRKQAMRAARAIVRAYDNDGAPHPAFSYPME